VKRRGAPRRPQPRDIQGRYTRRPQPPLWATALVFAFMGGVIVLVVVVGD
jgi:hypothetical protein